MYNIVQESMSKESDGGGNSHSRPLNPHLQALLSQPIQQAESIKLMILLGELGC